MQLLLAPMEGLLDFVLRDVLTRIGGADRCVSEFIRISCQSASNSFQVSASKFFQLLRLI